MRRTALSAIAVIALAFVACGDDKVVGSDDEDSLEIVRDGAFSGHSRTVGQEVNCYFGDPKWSTLKGEDGNRYVNLEGILSVSGVNTEATVQFLVDKSAKTFEVNAMEIAGVAQGQDIILELVTGLGEACG